MRPACIINSRIKRVLKILLFGSLLSLNSSYAQNLTGLKSIFVEELRLMDMFFDDGIFLLEGNLIDSSFVKVNSCNVYHEYLPKNSEYDSKSLDIYVVNVSFIGLQTDPTKTVNLDTIEFRYVLIKQDVYPKFYKLFGFFTTDINYLQFSYWNKEKFRYFLNFLSMSLVKNKVSSKSESNGLCKAILGNNDIYPKSVKANVNVLNVIFPNRIYRTTILDYEAIKPFIVH